MATPPSSHDAPTSGEDPGLPTGRTATGRAPFRPVGGPPLEEPGQTIGPYHLLRVLGEGGFGVVYLAERREPHVQRVALKVIKPGMDSGAVIARFEAERQALAIMDHPNVARVFDAGTTGSGRPYFVMEYVAGEPITAYCDRRSLPMRDRLAIFVDVCEAVQHAHHKGIIHRDLKPSNILVAEHDGRAIPKVIDFGVAKAISRSLAERSVFTEVGQLIGTPEYMSPEQAGMGAMDIDTRTDVYSLGVVLYELLTGAMPFDPRTLRLAGFDEIRRIIREVDPPRPSTRLSSMGDVAATVAQRRGTEPAALEKELRAELEWIPLKALRKDRAQRYRTPLELADDVRNYLAGRPLIAGPESAAYRARKFLRRNRAPVGAAAAVLAALVVGLAGTVWQATVATRQRDEARRQERRAAAAAAESTAKSDFLISALQSAGTVGGDGPGVTVATVIDRTAPRVDEQFAAQPEVRLSLHEMYGRIYRSLSLHPKADAHLRAALKIARQILRPDDPRIVELLTLLGTVLLERGRDAEASSIFADLSRTAAGGGGGPAGEQAAVIANHLAALAWNAGDYELAEYRYREALRRYAAAAPDSRGAIYAEGDLGRLLVDAGMLGMAGPLVTRSLDLRRRADGEPSMSVAYGLMTLGYLGHARGDLAGAAEAYRQSRAMYTARLESPLKPMVAMARMDLAGLVEDAGPDERGWIDASDTDPPFVLDDLEHMRWIAAISLRNRGRILYARGRIADGDDRFRRSIDVDRAIAAAARAPEDARERLLSEAHTRRVWADLLRGAGLLDRAEVEYRAALAAQSSVATGDLEIVRAPTLIGFGDLALRRGRAEDAKALAEEAFRLRRGVLGDRAWPSATAAAALARALVALGRFEEAEALLVPAIADIEVALGRDDPRAAAARRAAAAMYEAWARPQQAERIRGVQLEGAKQGFRDR
jgi:serine/threonine protein kinase/flagellar biosynthesis regulator FlaF